MVLDQLALYHAATHDILNKYPGGKEAFTKENDIAMYSDLLFEGSEEMIKMNEWWIGSLYKSTVDIIGDHCTVPFVDDHYPGRMEKYSKTKNMKNVLKGLPEKREKQFECLIHGDAWCNNFLFK